MNWAAISPLTAALTRCPVAVVALGILVIKLAAVPNYPTPNKAAAKPKMSLLNIPPK